jgi:outer membrane lipoprotein-sorting protein
MKRIILILGIAIGLFAQSSLDIAKKSYEMVSGYESSISETTMVLINAYGVENIRKLKIKKLENANGDKSILLFLYPNDIKGTKLLSFEQIGGDDKQWLYLPALKRVKRISSSNKSGSFMASEFSYEDISSQNYKNYVYDDEVEKVTKNNDEYFKLTRIPKDENSGYLKQVIYVDVNTYLLKFGEYYDKQNRYLKNISYLDYKKVDGVYRVGKIQIKNLQNDKSTILMWDVDKIKTGLKDNIFSKRFLQ